MSVSKTIWLASLACPLALSASAAVSHVHADVPAESVTLSLADAPVACAKLELWEIQPTTQRGERFLGHFTWGSDTNGVFLGGVRKYGPDYGVKVPTDIAVTPGERMRLAFEGLSPDADSTFVVYVTALDAAGGNVSARVAPPPSWSYSPFTHAFFQLALKPERIGVWEKLELSLTVPEGVSAIRVLIAPWRGSGVRCRAFSATAKPGVTRCRVDLSGEADALRLETSSASAADGAVTITATVSDRAEPPRPRALELRLVVPKDLTGWTWHRHWRPAADILNDETIVNDFSGRDDQTVGGHPVSRFPFTAVSRDGVGFALGMPIGEVAYESRVVTTNGIASTVAIGLLARPAGGTRATFRWQLFPFRGTWGFRSAARAYYDLQGGAFPEPRADAKEGTWLWPIWPSRAPENPGDFGLTFWEAPSTIVRKPREIEAAHARGIGVFPYTEAWGMRQPLATNADGSHPSVDERLSELKGWAATNVPGKIWFDVPRHIAAEAALVSMPEKPEGGPPFVVDKWDCWTHWWRTNADPRLKRPNRASICWDALFGADGRGLDAVDGLYLDSVTYGFSVNFCNVRTDHLAVMDETLVYDRDTGRPCADGMQHQVAFVRWVSDRLHARGKRVFGNVFGIAHRFHATTIDIFGSEVGGWGRPQGEQRFHDGQSDVEACEKRFFARHRPVTDLLQEGWYEKPVPEFSAAAMTNYVARQIFYAFYPGVSTIGGEKKAGYANWLRYFGPQRQCERDRELFKAAVPLIRRLNRAQWQPETEVTSSNCRVWVERFGTLPGDCFITVRNASDKTETAALTFGGKSADGKPIKPTPVWQGSPEPIAASEGIRLTLRPWQTAVYSL